MAEGLVHVKRALVSVFDKQGIDVLGPALARHGVTVLSTGGTAAALRKAGVPVVDVQDVTKWPEMLGGRVKTLHPAIHGGLLANRKEEQHLKELADLNIEPIDMVISNLYPFEKTVASGKGFEDCIEMIDIGGPTMVRAAAKNCDSVAVVTSPDQYEAVLAEMDKTGGALSVATRRKLAAKAFTRTCEYDAAVAAYMTKETTPDQAVSSRLYVQGGALRYGANPHQSPASYASVLGHALPFRVVNGQPGYINLMDALNAWQLVRELNSALDLPAAASFKHVSPAGAAVATPLSAQLAKAYEVDPSTLSDQALAYVRARGADPLSSYGDFVAISGVVDESTARLLQFEVSDGIIASGFEPAALEILKAKKKGRYLILEGNLKYAAPADEVKEVFGVALTQIRNTATITPDLVNSKVVTKQSIHQEALRDLVVATIAVKYTQSNSVCYAAEGQVIGVGAGQQSRVDCVKLAGRKVDTWRARTHPKVLNLKFKAGVKKQARINARVAYISNDMTPQEKTHWEELFEEVPEPLTMEESREWAASFKNVSLSSDAFFPFRDNIDQAAKHGVAFVTQPGGSVQDDTVIEACDEYGMAMSFTGTRLFHH
ncbi:5-aminoimidazole-4-carboxamide ribonucleotide transformylase [Salpingoeca rosetta]|uniref:5-aminoimidazole-4-carboxamide ribonucleotide transformylase n=1 Tax=Salpingoeca rosetta (strain ATCC 50818 / BSB-021) TaxID=946362 RepID=F2U8R4_SALR5|nr:5-aminoimidazole-4-carboxamide ribonucleotide transformylase [Salpingoeca rosetta]EGD72772.1 5-aminoimidazole-4-carboxamide ribonucleotide transformylase [Salpingoeca rosetta]|eukprot:XP_004994595.1 5-aminoimidazole-4-carboxamide ribonucleotide transformylase [Salpingoeca rosetta]